MDNKYQVKIDDSVMPELYTFDQLIDEGLLDEVDEKIKVRLNGEDVWQTARSYPFAEVEHRSREQQTHNIIHDDYIMQEQLTSHSRLSQMDYPPIVGKWNWGAFGLSWLWGLFNGLYWPLMVIALNFIPYIGFVLSLCICFILGKWGNGIAWKIAKRKGISINGFIDNQKKWNLAGVIFLSIVTIIIFLFFIVYQ